MVDVIDDADHLLFELLEILELLLFLARSWRDFIKESFDSFVFELVVVVEDFDVGVGIAGP